MPESCLNWDCNIVVPCKLGFCVLSERQWRKCATWEWHGLMEAQSVRLELVIGKLWVQKPALQSCHCLVLDQDPKHPQLLSCISCINCKYDCKHTVIFKIAIATGYESPRITAPMLNGKRYTLFYCHIWWLDVASRHSCSLHMTRGIEHGQNYYQKTIRLYATLQLLWGSSDSCWQCISVLLLGVCQVEWFAT